MGRLSLTGKIYLYTQPADMPTGTDHAVGPVWEVQNAGAMGGDAFVFLSGRLDRSNGPGWPWGVMDGGGAGDLPSGRWGT